MRYRHAEILANQDLGPSGTKTIDLNVVDIISRITLVHQPVGGSNTQVAHPAKNVEKLQLIDGSDALFSLSGNQTQALNCLEAPVPILQEVDARTGGTPLTYFNIDFGRHLWDPVLAFDPKKFRNPQLKLTWNEANYDASCQAHGFQIYAHLFDEKAVTPLGFLMNKEVRSYQPVLGAFEPTDLPTDYPIRKLIVQGLKPGAGVRGLIQELRLSEDNDKRIPIDGDTHNLRSFLDQLAGDCIDVIRGNCGATSQYYFCTASDLFTLTTTGDTDAKVIASGAPSGGRFWVKTETGTIGIVAVARGKNPHGCISIPFGLQDDLEDWYDVTKLGTLSLRIKGGPNVAAGDAINIVTQQLRRYAAA